MHLERNVWFSKGLPIQSQLTLKNHFENSFIVEMSWFYLQMASLKVLNLYKI